MNGWCVLWYRCTWQAWMLNLSHRLRMLEEVKVLIASALWWWYLSYYWSELHQTCMEMRLMYTDAPDRLECWIWAIGFGCWMRFSFLEQVTCFIDDSLHSWFNYIINETQRLLQMQSLISIIKDAKEISYLTQTCSIDRCVCW